MLCGGRTSSGSGSAAESLLKSQFCNFTQLTEESGEGWPVFRFLFPAMIHDLVDMRGGQPGLVQPKSGTDVFHHLGVASVFIRDFAFAEDFPH